MSAPTALRLGRRGWAWAEGYCGRSRRTHYFVPLLTMPGVVKSLCREWVLERDAVTWVDGTKAACVMCRQARRGPLTILPGGPAT